MSKHTLVIEIPDELVGYSPEVVVALALLGLRGRLKRRVRQAQRRADAKQMRQMMGKGMSKDKAQKVVDIFGSTQVHPPVYLVDKD